MRWLKFKIVPVAVIITLLSVAPFVLAADCDEINYVLFLKVSDNHDQFKELRKTHVCVNLEEQNTEELVANPVRQFDGFDGIQILIGEGNNITRVFWPDNPTVGTALGSTRINTRVIKGNSANCVIEGDLELFESQIIRLKVDREGVAFQSEYFEPILSKNQDACQRLNQNLLADEPRDYEVWQPPIGINDQAKIALKEQRGFGFSLLGHLTYEQLMTEVEVLIKSKEPKVGKSNPYAAAALNMAREVTVQIERIQSPTP